MKRNVTMRHCDECGGKMAHVDDARDRVRSPTGVRGRVLKEDQFRCLDCGWEEGAFESAECDFCGEDRRDGCSCHMDFFGFPENCPSD